MRKINKSILISFLKNYNHLDKLLYYYRDNDGRFEEVIKTVNEFKSGPIHLQSQNTRSNRRIIAYYARKELEKRKTNEKLVCNTNSAAKVDLDAKMAEVELTSFNDINQLEEDSFCPGEFKNIISQEHSYCAPLQEERAKTQKNFFEDTEIMQENNGPEKSKVSSTINNNTYKPYHTKSTFQSHPHSGCIIETTEIYDMEWYTNNEFVSYTNFYPDMESTKIFNANEIPQYKTLQELPSQQVTKISRDQNVVETGLNISSLIPKHDSEGTKEESIDARVYTAYRRPKSPKEKPNRSVRMVEILKGKSAKTPFFKNLMQDYLREQYDIFNNVCDLNVYSSKFNNDRSVYTMYAYCNDNACCTFKFQLNMGNKTCMVFRSKEELQHQIGYNKCYQIRGIERHVLKSELLKKKSVLYRKEAINKQSKYLRLIGRKQNVRPLATIRKARSEAMSDFEYDKDPFIDAFIMSETSYKNYIQRLATPLRVYLYTIERLQMLHKYDSLLSKKSDYTMRIDATGGVIQPISCANKRVFLYSIISHFPDSKKIYPVADAILSCHTSYEISLFLHQLKDACKENNILWPICNRIVTDCSYAIINSILSEFNGLENIQEYLIKCYQFLHSVPYQKQNFVVCQFCTSHYSKIICKDIDERVPLKNIKLREFLREAIGLAFNFTTLKECKDWFKMISIILNGCYLNHEVSSVMNKFLKFAKTPIEENIFDDQNGKIFLKELKTNTLDNIANSSPFTAEFQEILSNTSTLQLLEVDGLENPLYCPEFLDFMLKKYVAFLPFWTNIIGYHVSNKKELATKGSNVFGKIANKDMKSVKESWNKKGKQSRLKQPMFTKEFSGLQKIKDKIENLEIDRFTLQHDHEYINRSLIKTPQYNPYKLYSYETLTNFNQDRLFICDLKNVYDKYLVGQVYEDTIISLLELETLRPRQWLRNNIVNGCLAIILKENNSNYRAIPVQIEEYSFSNRIILENALSKCSTSLLVPHLINNHYYLMILNVETKEICCLDPKQCKKIPQKLISHYVNEINILKNEKWSEKQLIFDKQHDNVECGIFILQYAERFVKSMPMTNLEAKSPYRKRMHTKLLEYSSLNICLHCSATRNTAIAEFQRTSELYQSAILLIPEVNCVQKRAKHILDCMPTGDASQVKYLATRNE
ncbi:uncharacterized protein LOC142235706 [Haematobia irritans]|uniref:uncharacterized protein LOC142235706 n=1 Tax=Haematobia irritans TaxID=7368 RepID=UPI003F4F42F3